ncbi:MAG: gamma carbonic anhydrase family protein [Clostridia bacterium]|nr:gamma carbonic anhydrase family protein [Clostridia bacterium]
MIMEFGGKKPEIEEGVFVAHSADIIGDVKVKKGSSLWFSAVLRGDMAEITVGENTSIQDNCTVHADAGKPCHIGNNVTVGHNAVVHGCTVGDNSVIGMNSTVLNGAVIGKNCLIGAGALVKEKDVIPDNSLAVGVPAKVIRTFDESAESYMQKNAEEYAELAKEYLKQE